MSICHAPTEIFRRLPSLLPSYWQRRRGTLGPPQVLLSLMTMSVLGCKGYERTLDELKCRLGEELGWTTPSTTPSGQALSQARRKLTPVRCREVVTQVYALCTTARSQAALGYGGLRLLALDGTKLTLPAYRALREYFGCPVQSPLGPQASFTMLWDVGANQPVDWRVGPYRVCERIHAHEFIAAVGAGDLLLADRNFPSRRMLLALHERRADWLMRVRCAGAGTLAEVVAFVAAGISDQQVTLVQRDHHGNPLPIALSLSVRLLRKELADGSVAVFITSLLDPLRHPAATLIDLYAARWRVETAFRELKIWYGLERFHARYPDGISQEIAALMLFQLLSSELEAQARIHHGTTIDPIGPPNEPHQVRQNNLRFNRRIVADCAVNLLYAAAHGDLHLRQTFDYSLYRIWRYRQTIRPGRSFPRERKSPARGYRNRAAIGNMML